MDENWGGSPVDLSFNDAIIEELKKAIEERGLDVPPFYGLALDDESADMEQIISDFRAFVKSIA